MSGSKRSFSIFQSITRLALIVSSLVLSGTASIAGIVEVRDNQLFVDNLAQPQLYGAELQYFRLRGGTAKNIPRDQVIALWNQALDRMVEANMNTISFYIPWDFHEYANGQFDFTGTVDEDGDGKADYPSRDLVTFFRLIKEHGIKHIMVRPGPYINAEWGFLGFGPVPEWFHQQYPDSHMSSPQGQRTKLYDYSNPDFRQHSRRWLKALYDQVLVHYIGPGQPIDFIQLDNETNYLWQSLYNLDYSPSALTRYRLFLQSQYHNLAELNDAHSRNWTTWEEIKAPVTAGINIAEDGDWYRFHDETIHEYLHFVRQVWENLGVHEPAVLFTLAESYNAADQGLLPNYKLRNDPGVTGLMTVNLYPKTQDNDQHPLFNQPFKADHDVKATGSANERYFGQRQEWAFGPEIQGGWWRGTNVSSKARQQTFLSTIGHGLKALMIYYFNEGDNFGYEWVPAQIKPLFQELRQQPPYAGIPDALLPPAFWDKLQSQSDERILVGIDVKSAVMDDPVLASQLYFDAPLDAAANPKPHYALVKQIGETLIAGHGDFLGRAIEMTDPVCLVKDVNQHVPSPVPGVDSVLMNSYWAGGLLGLVMQSGINPKILHWGITPVAEFRSCRLLILQDNGRLSANLVSTLKKLAQNGATVLNFLGDDLAVRLMDNKLSKSENPGGIKARLSTGPKQDLFSLSRPAYAVYNLQSVPGAQPFLQDENGQIIGFRWKIGAGELIQISALFYEHFNSDQYSELADVPLRRGVIDKILNQTGIQARLNIIGPADRVVAFGRQAPEGGDFWITSKSGNTDKAVNFHLALRDAQATKTYRITNVLENSTIIMKGKELADKGMPVSLSANGSAAFRVQDIDKCSD